MLPIKSFVNTAAVLTLGLGALSTLADSAAADDSQFYGVANMDVALTGAGPEIVVKNVAGNHQLQNLQLAVQGNTVSVGVGGFVDCTGVQIENWTYREGHFLAAGAFGIGRSSLLMSQNLPASSDIDHVSDMDAKTFQMPLALLANPQVDIDPLALVMAAAETAPSKLAYLRQDHTIVVKLPLRWEAECAYYLRNKITKKTTIESPETSYLTKDVTLKIKYQGDPALFEVNAQIAQGGGLPNQLQAGDQPFKITAMSFLPNMPHHSGACPATTKIRVNYQGQGKGEIRIRINDGGQTIYESPKIAFDAKNGLQHHDFEIATPKAAKLDLNKTVVHNLRAYVRGKGEEAQVWPSSYQLMDQAVWKHRCTPQLNPVIGGAGGGAVGGYQNGGGQGNAPSLPKLPLRATPPEPAPTIKRAQ